MANILKIKRFQSYGNRLLRQFYCRIKLLNSLVLGPPRCKLCDSFTKPTLGYSRVFFKCIECEFIFSSDYDLPNINKGMGMEGSWSGLGGGGYREHYLVMMLKQDLKLNSFLLYGTGNTPTFGQLRLEKIDVVGCDISPDVVKLKKVSFGNDTFFTPESLPCNKRYDCIVAVEVLEHFTDPIEAFTLLFDHLTPDGVLCGTTNFYHGGSIEDGNNPGYMSHKCHVAYWSKKSIEYISRKHKRDVVLFEMIRPGSVLPDEKYGQLWPNKRVFFIYNPSIHKDFFKNLLNTSKILPIDKP